MLSLHELKRILNPVSNTLPADDFRIIDTWSEYEGDSASKNSKLKFICFEIITVDPETGTTNHLYKAIRLARVERLPKSARQSTSFMQMQSQVLSAVHEQGYNLITLIANMIRPVPEGLMYLYGVQGVADNIEEAKKRAEADYHGFIGAMMGTFRVLHMRTVTAEEGAWIEAKMRSMKYMTAVRGIPKANTEGEDIGNKGVGGSNLNPESQGTLEEIITAMSDFEYVIEVLSTPVYKRTLMSWSTMTQKQMTEWNGQLQGTKSLSFNLSLPMTYMTSTGNSQGWSKNYTDSKSVSYTKGESYNTGYSESVGKSISQSLGESFGLTKGNSVTDSTGTSHSVSQGLTHGQSVGYSEGLTHGQTVGQTHSVSNGSSIGFSNGLSKGFSSGVNHSESQGTNFGNTIGSSRGISIGNSDSESRSHSYGESQSHSQSQSVSDSVSDSTSHSISQSHSAGISNGQNISNSFNQSYGQSQNVSHSTGTNESSSVGTNHSFSNGGSSSHSQSQSSSNGGSSSLGLSHSTGSSSNESYSTGSNQSTGTSDSINNGSNWGMNGSVKIPVVPVSAGGSFGESSGNSHGTSSSTGSSESTTHGTGTSESNSLSTSVGTNYSNSKGTTDTQGTSWSNSNGTSSSQSAGISESYSVGNGSSYSQGYGTSYGSSQSQTYSNSQGISDGVTQGKSHGVSHGTSDGTSLSRSSSEGTTHGTSYGENSSNSYSQSMGSSNSYSKGENFGTSESSSFSRTASQSASVSDSASLSESLSQSYSQSKSESISESQSVSDGTSQSRSIGKSESESYTQSVSNGMGENWGESNSISQGRSTSEGESQSHGSSMGTTGSFTTGTSGSMGIGPSFGYSKSYQWLDQQVKDILELLEYQNERLKKALRGEGAFYTYVYIACPDLDALYTAQAAAKSTWQNSMAMTQPIQILDLSDEEQQHLLYHFTAFSADVTRENIAGISDYKYATVLLPDEYVAYTHLPRVSEGGIDTNIDDIPKFRVPGLLRGSIYMGTQLNPERYTFRNGYRTQFDYRIHIDELMHGVFTGQSRSGKTVAAMRFIKELAHSRRTATGKRLRIVIMDPKQDWRGIARFVEPERFRFYSMGNTHFRPIHLNPCKIPYGVEPQHWIDGIINIYCRAYGLLERGKQMLSDVFYELYNNEGIFADENEQEKYSDWKAEVTRRSGNVTFHKLYKRLQQKSSALQSPGKKAGNDTLDAYSRLLERLSCFSRPYSIEYRLFSAEDDFENPNSKGTGMGVDELIGDDDVTVFESFGLESTFANFIFGIITSGFYKVAKGFERGYLHPDQYETVLVIEEANKVLTGNDTAGTGGGGMASLSGQSEFEEILDQSAGYGLFIIAITQKISMMPSSIIANCGLLFMGKLSQPEDVDLGVRMIGREGRIEDRDVVKWLPKSPTGWFICRSNRGYDFRDAEPSIIMVEQLNAANVSNNELEEILVQKEVKGLLRG